jgi:hypothetical protein
MPFDPNESDEEALERLIGGVRVPSQPPTERRRESESPPGRDRRRQTNEPARRPTADDVRRSLYDEPF